MSFELLNSSHVKHHSTKVIVENIIVWYIAHIIFLVLDLDYWIIAYWDAISHKIMVISELVCTLKTVVNNLWLD